MEIKYAVCNKIDVIEEVISIKNHLMKVDFIILPKSEFQKITARTALIKTVPIGMPRPLISQEKPGTH